MKFRLPKDAEWEFADLVCTETARSRSKEIGKSDSSKQATKWL